MFERPCEFQDSALRANLFPSQQCEVLNKDWTKGRSSLTGHVTVERCLPSRDPRTSPQCHAKRKTLAALLNPLCLTWNRVCGRSSVLYEEVFKHLLIFIVTLKSRQSCPHVLFSWINWAKLTCRQFSLQKQLLEPTMSHSVAQNTQLFLSSSTTVKV